MASDDRQLLAFNRGVISSIGLARIDLQRYAMSAEIQKNYIPRVLGSMMLRPGTQFIDYMNEDLNLVRQMPFIFEEDDTALLEFGTTAYLRIRINDVLLARPAVATTIDNPSFVGAPDADDTSPPTDWTIDDDANCDSFILDFNLMLRGSGEGFARTYQTITVAGPDQNVEHCLGIGVLEGPVRLRVGSTVQGSEYIADTLLDKGAHSISFTPTGDFTVELSNDRDYNIVVTSCNIVQDTIVQFTTPWSVEDQVRSVRWEQSGDRIYCSADGIQQKTIERRFDGRSWSVTDYVTDDGPFRVQNVGSTTLEVNKTSGDYDVGGGGTVGFAVLTASEPIFKIPHQGGAFGPGALFRAASSGQIVTNTAAADTGVFAGPIRVVGAEEGREFGIIIEGVYVGTVTLQFAFDESGPWNDQGETWVNIPISTTFKDGQDGAIIYYRLIVKIGDFTSGPVTMTMNYTGGSIQGIARCFQRVDEENMRVHIIKAFGSLDPTKDWWESEWSGVRGFPTAVAIHEGRLFWGGQDRIWASISDAFNSFDDNTVGDSGPISRTIGSGAIRVINWMMSMARLIMGTSEHSANVAGQRMDGNNPLSARSTTFEEPLTPFNFNIKTVSSRGVFVDRTRQRLYELLYDVDVQDYKSMDLSIFAPDFNIAGIVQIAVQMKPDIRVHCVRADGTVGMLVYDRLENVIAWVDIELGGPGNWCIEDVAVLPGTIEDQVYYTVKAFNSVDGEERYLLKWSLESEAIGGLDNYLGDAWMQYDGAPIDTMVGIDHLAGHTVSVWADGVYEGTGVVTQFGSPGELDLTDLTLNGLPNDAGQSSNVIVSLSYMAQYKSTKLAAIDGIGLLERKKVNRLGFIAENLHHRGIQYGPDFDTLYDLPAVEEGQVVATDTIYETYHEDDFPFGGGWDPDSRICLQSESPKPATIIAAVAEYESVENLNTDRRSR